MVDGQRFGHLVVSAVSRNPQRRLIAACRCDCGALRTVRVDHLKRGLSTSCGCVRNAETRARMTRHGGTKWPEYAVWCTMIARCTNPNSENYPRYGGRGIRVVPEWAGSFARFIADMGRRPSDAHSIDRIDNDGDYASGNCRWAIATEQARNRCSSALITFQGETKTLTEWAAATGLSVSVISTRLHRNRWSVEEALTTPARIGQKVHSTAVRKEIVNG